MANPLITTGAIALTHDLAVNQPDAMLEAIEDTGLRIVERP